MTTLTSHAHALRDRVRTRIEKRVAHQQLVRELAGYRTPAQRAELDAILDRGEPQQAAQLRKIVDAQRAAA